jgi:hypothetical protein
VLEDPDRAKDLLAPLAGQVEIIVHAFSGEEAVLRKWVANFGAAVTHVHVARHEAPAGYRTLREVASIARERIAILRDGGFAGTWTIEFTRGVAAGPEDRDKLLANAADDLAFLRENL